MLPAVLKLKQSYRYRLRHAVAAAVNNKEI